MPFSGLLRSYSTLHFPTTLLSFLGVAEKLRSGRDQWRRWELYGKVGSEIDSASKLQWERILVSPPFLLPVSRPSFPFKMATSSVRSPVPVPPPEFTGPASKPPLQHAILYQHSRLTKITTEPLDIPCLKLLLTQKHWMEIKSQSSCSTDTLNRTRLIYYYWVKSWLHPTTNIVKELLTHRR